MKQILQSLSDGSINILETPSPSIKDGHLLISTSTSLISVGTERMLLEFGKANYLEKAKNNQIKLKTY